MEIRTCEQFVLAVLKNKSREIERLEKKLASAIAERDAMKTKADDLERELGREPGTIEAAVIKVGRQNLFHDCTYATVTDVKNRDGETIPFRVWCEEAMRDYGRPKGVSVSEFIEFFEPEFREAYDGKLADGK